MTDAIWPTRVQGELDEISTCKEYLQVRRKKPMHMGDWVERLDAFLQFNERNILTHAGAVSAELARKHADEQFEIHDAERRRLEAEQPTSDFDKAVEEVKRLEGGD